MTTTTELCLPPVLSRIYAALIGEGDVAIDALLHAAQIQAPEKLRQEYLGPYITRLNRRLKNHGRAVKPGQLKGTYRLVIV